jgi:acetyl-CoA carboxylase carboxyltransferase component
MPGLAQEQAGIIRHGAKVLYAYSEATVPKIGIILRKAFGGAYIAMNSKKMGADLIFALPIAQVAVMGAEGAVDIMYKKEVAEDSSKRDEFIKEYEKHFMNPYIAASRGLVDEVIKPEEMKKTIKMALLSLDKKRVEEPWKKHGNIPL